MICTVMYGSGQQLPMRSLIMRVLSKCYVITMYYVAVAGWMRLLHAVLIVAQGNAIPLELKLSAFAFVAPQNHSGYNAVLLMISGKGMID